MSETLKDALKIWQEEILEPTLKRHPERKDPFKTSSGIQLQRFYLPTVPDPRYQDQVGFPGTACMWSSVTRLLSSGYARNQRRQL